MCGIYGYCSRTSTQPRAEEVDRAKALLRHRGPDGQGETSLVAGDRTVLLGHTRLAIIDLSPGGHQPMTSGCGRFTITFNGEIYNYRELRRELQGLGVRFRSESDTEVLLEAWAAWGVRCLTRLVGMFAFAIADQAEGTLTLVRDAFGIKPLFHCTTARGAFFASEMPAILAIARPPGEVNEERAYQYLVRNEQDLGFETFVQGVSHLPPAHLAVFDMRDDAPEPRYRRWWNPSIEQSSTIGFRQAAKRFRELFLESVALHLRSDVPLGLALSGGLDSSAIAGAMRTIEPGAEIHAFTYVNADASENEERWADLVIDSIGAVSHKIHITAADLDRDLEDLIRVQGEPFGSTTMYAQYCVLREARRNGIVVVLEGQGADELLGGYIGYPSARMLSLVERLEITRAMAFARQARRWQGCANYRPWATAAKQLLPQGLRRMAAGLAGTHRPPDWISSQAVRRLRLGVAPRRENMFRPGRGRRLMEVLLDEMTWTNLPTLMRYGDRSAMRFSVENRVPFLTIPLAEFVLSLPEEYLVSDDGETKRLLREAMRGIVPDPILDRRDKVAFRTPTGEWMQGGLLASLKRGRFAPRPGSLLDTPILISQLEADARGDRAAQHRAWRILNFLAWQEVVLGQQAMPR